MSMSIVVAPIVHREPCCRPAPVTILKKGVKARDVVQHLERQSSRVRAKGGLGDVDQQGPATVQPKDVDRAGG
jgi:hypothetical protein